MYPSNGKFLHARHAVKFYVSPVAKNKCMLSIESLFCNLLCMMFSVPKSVFFVLHLE